MIGEPAGFAPESAAHSHPEGAQRGRMGPYRLHEVLGEGGMGVVFRATHAQRGEEVALKTVNRVTRRRMLALREEIVALRAVEHPGLVRILDQGSHDGIPWYAMELLTGKTLAHYNDALWDSGLEVTRSGVSRTAWPEAGTQSDAASAAVRARSVAPQSAVAGGSIDAALRLYSTLCEPLGHMHARGMVHRDLKPPNVFIRTDERPVLMDFGLIGYASGAIGREILEAGNQGFGTVHYVSPERIEGRQVDARADLYSLGCMLYETLVGRPPFVGEPGHVLSQHLSSDPIAPSRIVDGVPLEVEHMILQLLAKNPRERIGHAHDVAAVLARVAGSRTPQWDSDSVPLFRPYLSGRDDVLAALSGSLQRAIEGHGSMVLIGGESGIGKTFLTSELAHAAVKRGFRVVTGGAMQFSPDRGPHGQESVGPFQALRSVLQTIADGCRETGPEERERILGRRALYLAPFEPAFESFVMLDTAAPADTLPGSANLERIKSALADTLQAYASTGPLLIIVDDVQWADELSTSFLAGLDASFFEHLPLAIVCAYRTEHAQASIEGLLASDACTKLMLGNLGEAAVRRMVADMLASEPSQELVDFLVRESEGNPFFVAEYLRYLVAGKYLERAQGRWLSSKQREGGATDYSAIHMPGKLEELLRWRLQALSELAQRVLQAAAVLGRTFGLEVLGQLAGVSEEQLLEVLAEARQRLVLESLELNSYRFRHDKLREATYASLSPEECRTLHASAACALETVPAAHSDSSRARELAFHYELGGEPAHALRHFVNAAEEALEKAALQEAIEHFRSALRLNRLVGSADASEEARWERMLGAALHDIGDFPGGTLHLERALTLLGERSARVRRAPLGLLIGLEVLKQARTRVGPARRQLVANDARRALQRAKIHDRIQQAAYYTDDALPMLYSCMRMLNLAEQVEPSSTLTVAYANAHAVAGVMPSRRLAALYVSLARRNLRAAPSDVARAHLCLIAVGYATGIADWSSAFAAIEEGLEACARVDFAQRARELCAATSSARYLTAEFALARAAATRLRAQAVGKDSHTHCWALLLEAQIQLVEGDLEGSLANSRLTQPLLRTLGRPERIWSHSLEAFAHAKSGDEAAAERAADAALVDVVGAPLMNYFVVDAVARCAEVRLWLCRRATRRREKERAAHSALRALEAMKRPFPIAEPRLRLLQGLWQRARGNERRAEVHFRACAAAAQRLSMPYEQARALLALSTIDPTARAAGEQVLTRLGASIVSARPLDVPTLR